jgi:hypothetical protein
VDRNVQNQVENNSNNNIENLHLLKESSNNFQHSNSKSFKSMISSKSHAFESMYNFWPKEGMRCNNRIITPKKSFETLGAHTNCNTSILFNTPMKSYDEYEELLFEDEDKSIKSKD